MGDTTAFTPGGGFKFANCVHIRNQNMRKGVVVVVFFYNGRESRGV